MKLRIKKVFVFVFSAVILLFVWQISAEKIASPLVLPLPKSVLQSIFQTFSTKKFASAFVATFSRCALSFFISAFFGFVLGLCFAFFPSVETFFEPLLSLVRAVPVVSIILLALFWLKSSSVPVFVAVLMTLPVMTLSVRAGFSVNDAERKKLLEMADCFSLSSAQKLLFLHIPRSFPAVSSGVKSISAMIWKLVCAGEVLSLPRSAVGSLLQNAQVVLETADVFAITLIIVFSSFCFCSAVNLLLFAFRKTSRLFTLLYFSKSKKIALSCPLKAGKDFSVTDISVLRNGFLFKDFSLTLKANCTTAILAPSGRGKTTLLDVVAKRAIAEGFRVSYLFQEPRLLPSLTVLENVALPLCRVFGAKKALFEAEKMLRALSLGEKLHSFPDELSGGERQRASMARAFSFPADILLLDEPFQSQDFSRKLSIFETMKNGIEKKAICALVTHDPFEASRLAQRVIFLDGRPVKIALDLDIRAMSAENAEKIIIDAMLQAQT